MIAEYRLNFMFFFVFYVTLAMPSEAIAGTVFPNAFENHVHHPSAACNAWASSEQIRGINGWFDACVPVT